jgi:hypothetical protein
MGLQDAIAKVETDIETTEVSLTSSGSASEGRIAQGQLRTLRETHKMLCDQAKGLYVSLNVEKEFPEYQKYGMEFVRTLVMTYNAKCILRHRLTGRFFEWDCLGRAVGSIHTPISQ